MKELIPVPKMSEVLREEFMQPLGLSAYRVAKNIMVPVSRIQEILQEEGDVSKKLTDEANKNGGMDNITVVVIKK